MRFLVPHLFPSARLLETAAQDLRLPALQTLLTRGTRTSSVADGIEAAVCEALGLPRQQDWPIAPITLEADGGTAGNDYWLRADPVHLRVMRDRIVLADSRDLELSQAEADALADVIARHFGDHLTPVPLAPTRWYLRLAEPPWLATTPPSLAIGCDIAPRLPHGADAARVRAQLNELQMLLHDHPLNQAREARGALAINSVWLWGGGTLPPVPARQATLYVGDDTLQALGRFCHAALRTLPARFDAAMLANDGVVVLDGLTAAGQSGDAYGWREALRALETAWFAPMLAGLRAQRHRLALADPISGRGLEAGPLEAWTIWRRPRNLISLLR